jgi:hypothetical protein
MALAFFTSVTRGTSRSTIVSRVLTDGVVSITLEGTTGVTSGHDSFLWWQPRSFQVQRSKVKGLMRMTAIITLMLCVIRAATRVTSVHDKSFWWRHKGRLDEGFLPRRISTKS